MAVIPIFVSSTFRDFHTERDILAGPVRERLDEHLKHLGCRVEFIDLRWGVDTLGINDDEAARRVVDVCLQQVQRARPLFLGLIGDRIGYIPEPEHARWVADQAHVPPEQHVEGLSVTELEFGYGMLWPSAPAGDHIVLFRHLDGPTPDGWADPDHHRVTTFWNHVAARAHELGAPRILYQTSVTPAGTADLNTVQTGNTRWTFEDLAVRILTPPARRRAEQIIAQSTDTRQGAERLFREDHRVAVGREHLIADLIATALAGRRSVLHGESGTGKSTIICAVEEALRTSDGATVVSALLGAATTGASGHDIVRQLAAQLRPILDRDISPPASDDDDEVVRWWADLLAEAAAKAHGRLIVIIDALDTLSDDRSRGDVWPARAVPTNVALLCSTIDSNQVDVLGTANVEPVTVGLLSAETAARAAQAWAGQTGRRLPRSVGDIIGPAPRSPLWIRVAVDLLADLDADDFAAIAHAPNQAAAIEQLLLSEASALPSGTPELAGVLLRRVATRIGDQPSDLLLGALAIARSGLDPVALADLLPQDPEAAHKVAVLQRVLGNQLRTTDVAGRLTFAHGAVRQHAASRIPAQIHQRLVTVLAGDQVWDHTDARDALWHTLNATAEAGNPQRRRRDRLLRAQFARAANHGPPGGAEVVMRALAACAETGIALVSALDGGSLSSGGLEMLLAAQERVDRRHLHPHDRVALSRALLTVARSSRGAAAELDVVWALINLGRASADVGDLDGARQAYDEALDLARRSLDPDTGRRIVGSLLNDIGDNLRSRGDLDTAQRAYEESLVLRRRLAEAQPDSAAACGDLAASLNKTGDVRLARGDLDSAQGAYDESLAIYRRLSRAEPDSADALRNVSVSLSRMSHVQKARGDLDGVQRSHEESLDICRRLLQGRPGSVQALRDLSIELTKIGDIRRICGDLGAAQQAYDESLDLARRLAEAQPGSVTALRDVGFSLDRTGDLLRVRGELAAAYRAYDESLKLRRHLARSQPTSVEAMRDVGLSLDRIGESRMAVGDIDGAEQVYRESLDLDRRVVQAQPDSVQALDDLGSTLAKTGDLQQMRGDLDAAHRSYDESLAVRRHVSRLQPGSAAALRDLSNSLDRVGVLGNLRGTPDAAHRAHEEALTIRRHLAQSQPKSMQALRDLSVTLVNIGDSWCDRGDLEAGGLAFDEALTLRRGLARAQPSSAQAVQDLTLSLVKVAVVRGAHGDADGARVSAGESVQYAREFHRLQPDATASLFLLVTALESYANILEQLGYVREAAAAQAEMVSLAEGLNLC